MIATDQPQCFSDDVLVAVSSREDGTMLDRTRGTHYPDAVKHRRIFCQKNNISYDDVVYQRIIYDKKRSYTTIAEVDHGATSTHTLEVVADALVTRVPGVALFLPVADCVATVAYDPVRRVLALLHLGRHSTVAGLTDKTLQRLIGEGSRPEDIIVWMSPRAQADTYVMQYFDQAEEPDWRGFCYRSSEGAHLDMQGYNAAVCRRAGIPEANIHRSPINTMTDPHYFSHARGDTSGRTAVVAMMH